VNVQSTSLPDVLLIEPKVFRDDRGFFLESFSAPRFADHDLPTTFPQDNHSRSVYGVLRGLHYQRRHPQGKLITVVHGEVFDVAVDVRRGSPTFGRWTAFVLNGERPQFIYVPPGFAHGFCVLTPVADVMYKCTDIFHPDDDHGVLWNDADLAIPWPIHDPVMSAKDAAYAPLSEDRTDLPDWT
jgi:dTDP-4-dehydrorhamnose 3,5-epimerase